jgi:CHAD domain-containing protein
MRVGTRRLRSDLRTFGPLLDRQWAESLREELKWFGGALGEVRDLDVLLERLRSEGGDLIPPLRSLLEDLELRRADARRVLLAALGSKRYVDLLERLVEAARNPRLSDGARAPSGDVLPALAARAWRRLAGPARALREDSRPEDFHRVRVLAKRARYATEAVAPALGRARGRKATRFAKRAAGVQGVLGELQDSAVASRTIEAFAQEHPGNGRLALASGRMLERERRAAEAARNAFPEAWRRLDRKQRRAWM